MLYVYVPAEPLIENDSNFNLILLSLKTIRFVRSYQVTNLGTPSNRYTYNDTENRYYTEIIAYSDFATISLTIVKKVTGSFPHFKLPDGINIITPTFLNGMYYSSDSGKYVANYFYAKGNEIISSQTANIDYGFFYGIIKL